MTELILQIKNWREFQHYKDRNPPWIKLSTHLFQDYDFSCLQDASKLLLIFLWTLASRYKGGIIKADFNFLCNQSGILNLNESHLKALIDQGFIIASNVLAERKQNAIPEKRQRRDREETEKKDQTSKISFEDLSVNHITEWLAEKRNLGKYLHHNEHDILETFKDYCKANGKTYKDYIAAFRNSFEWERNQPKPGYGNGIAQPPKSKVQRAAEALQRGREAMERRERGET